MIVEMACLFLAKRAIKKAVVKIVEDITNDKEKAKTAGLVTGAVLAVATLGIGLDLDAPDSDTTDA